jgi:hypothetical protein
MDARAAQVFEHSPPMVNLAVGQRAARRAPCRPFSLGLFSPTGPLEIGEINDVR